MTQELVQKDMMHCQNISVMHGNSWRYREKINGNFGRVYVGFPISYGTAKRERSNLMNVLEKILEEIESLHNKILKDRFAEQVTEQEIDSLIKVKEIVRSNMNEAKDINISSKDGWIDRKNLEEEIKSLRFMITGMRNGKTMTRLALEGYRKSM